MTNSLLITNILMITLLCFSCSDSTFKQYSVKGSGKMKKFTATVWQHPQQGSFYDDLRITPSFYLFLDSGNDTAIRVYKPDVPERLHSYHAESKNILNIKNGFIVSNTRFETGENEVWMSDCNQQLKRITPDGDNLLPKDSKNIFKDFSNTCYDYNITMDEIYVVDIGRSRKYLYGFFSPDSGFYWVDPPQYAGIAPPKAEYANLGNLVVSEKLKRAVCARRFINDVLFFDLHGNLKKSIIIGEEVQTPETLNGKIDTEKTRKYSIYLCATEQHVYRLYNGSNDYTAQSKIYVFDWEGKHIRTYQADRCLKQIDVDKQETYILALAANEAGGRDVVKFRI